MNTEQAIKILEQALNASAKAGVFNLQDSSTINTAMEIVKREYINSSEVNNEVEKEEKVKK